MASARELGLDLSRFEDPRQALSALVEDYKRFATPDPQIMADAELGRMIRGREAEVLTALRQTPQQQQQERYWNAPDYDPSLDDQITRNEQGAYVFADGTPVPHDILAARRNFQNFARKFYGQLAKDPMEALAPGLKPFKQEILQEVHNLLAERHVEQTARQLSESNREWMIHKDAFGRPQVDPMTGQPMLTEAGKRYASIIRQLESSGLSDPALIDRAAKSMIAAEMMERRQQAAAMHQQANQAVAPQAASPAAHTPNSSQAAAPLASQAGFSGATQGTKLYDKLVGSLAGVDITM